MTPVPYGRRRSKSRASRILLLLAATMTTLAVHVLPAAAHTELMSTTPADQQTVSRTPAVVTLTFDEAVLAMGTQVAVTGPQGPVQTGPPQVADTTVSQNISPGSPGGQYTVAWRVTAADGHPLSGTFSFTAETASDAEAPSVAASQATNTDETAGSTGSAIWMWLFAGLLGLAAVVGVVIRYLTRRTDLAPPT